MSNESLRIGNNSESGTQQTITGGNGAVSPDALFDALANSRRRFALRYLHNQGQVELTELAEQVAAHEYELTVGAVPVDTHKRVFTSLYHSHIPKLADVGLLEYDQEQEVVALAELDESVESCLGLLQRI